MKVEEFEDFAASGYNKIPVYQSLPYYTLNELTRLLKKPARAMVNFLDEKNEKISLITLEATQEFSYQHRKIMVKQHHHIRKHFDIDSIPPMNPLDWLSDYNSYFKTPLLPEFPRFSAGIIGYFGSQLAEFAHVKAAPVKSNQFPDFYFLLSDDVLIVNHDKKETWILTYVDPIVRDNCYEKARQKLVVLTAKIQAEITEIKIDETKNILKDIPSPSLEPLLTFEHRHAFALLTLFQDSVFQQDGLSLFSRLFNTDNFCSYFFQFEHFCLFGFGEHHARKMHQMAQLAFHPKTFPALTYPENWLNMSKITCEANLKSVCLSHALLCENDSWLGEIAPKFVAIDFIKTIMPHPLQVGSKTPLGITASLHYQPAVLPQQQGLIGMLNWHDDFMGQFNFFSFLGQNGTLSYAMPFFIDDSTSLLTLKAQWENIMFSSERTS